MRKLPNNGRRDPRFASIGLVEVGEELQRLRNGSQSPPAGARGLIGRFFHGDDENQWQGEVLAEPASGLYLVELFSWMTGEPCGQQLVKLEAMAGWTFYDDAQSMNFAYEHGGVARRWEKATKDRDGEAA